MKTEYVSRFVALCLLLALALTADAAGLLTGEQAIQHLKDGGQYESLAAAVTGADAKSTCGKAECLSFPEMVPQVVKIDKERGRIGLSMRV